KLLEIKDGLEHGQFTMWVENACYLKIRTAERAMQMAELVEKNVNLTYLPQQALLLLASRSAPKRLRDAIIRSIDAGERPAAAEIGRQLYRGREAKGPQPHDIPNEEQQVEPADREEESEGLPEILAGDVRDLDPVERVARRLITALGDDVAELVPDLERITTAALVQEVRHLRPNLFANRDHEDGAHRSQKKAHS